MGVTIHFSGTLRDDEALAGLESDARAFAARCGWAVETIDHAINHPDDYTGITIHPTSNCEPIHLVFDDNLGVEEHVKTQFAGPQTHVQVVALLRLIEPWFETLVIDDEGEYWISRDEGKLHLHMNIVSDRLAQLANESEDPEIGVRLPSGRIIDLRRKHTNLA